MIYLFHKILVLLESNHTCLEEIFKPNDWSAAMIYIFNGYRLMHLPSCLVMF